MDSVLHHNALDLVTLFDLALRLAAWQNLSFGAQRRLLLQERKRSFASLQMALPGQNSPKTVLPAKNRNSSRTFHICPFRTYLLAREPFKSQMPAPLAVETAVIFVCAGLFFPYYAIGFRESAGKGGIIS